MFPQEFSDISSDRRVTLLDPKSIEPAQWAQTDPFDYVGQRFERLKDSIAEFGGNLQPVKVQQTSHALGGSNYAAGATSNFELVFGYSRVRACLELGLPVLAMIEQVSAAEGLRQFVSFSRVGKASVETGRLQVQPNQPGHVLDEAHPEWLRAT
jgi:hypothetical protein